MGVTGGTALLIGIIRYVSDFPENLNGLFAEIHAYHVEPKWSPLVYILSALSLGLSFMTRIVHLLKYDNLIVDLLLCI